MHVTAIPKGDTLEWLFDDPAGIDENAWWFIDGSCYEGKHKQFRRTGLGVGVTSPDGSLIAFARGVPPDWVLDAAGAEAFWVGDHPAPLPTDPLHVVIARPYWIP